jgi:hypothetical protein
LVGGEFVSAQHVSALGGDAFNLTTLWRHLYGTSGGSHSIGDAFVRIDSSLFSFPLPPAIVDGSTLYFRFVGEGENLAGATTYSYTPTGSGYGTGTGGVPATPAAPGTSASPAGNVITWSPPTAADNAQTVTILRANGSGASIGAATAIDTVAAGSGSYTDVSAAPGAAYTYFVAVNNVIGTSTGSAGANASTVSSPNLWGFGWNIPVAAITPGVAFAYSYKGEAWTLPAGLPLAHCDIEGGAGPSSTTVFDLEVNGVSHGSMTFATSATSATFTWTADVALSSADQARVVPPANLNGMTGLLVGALVGPR